MRHVVMFSGGIGSWAAARRVQPEPGDDLILLFCDTMIEDLDLYRFLGEAAWNVFGGLPFGVKMDLLWLTEGRTPWQVFKNERYLGNTRADPCSKILKRQVADDWLNAHCDVVDTRVYVGIDWTEINRFDRLRERRRPWIYEAPLINPPYLAKSDMIAAALAGGLRPPRLYAMGFSHNNCGGGCIKAGMGHFAHLLDKLPQVYAEWERNEQAIRSFLGKDVAILRDRRGGKPTPLTLTALRERIEAAGEVDQFEIGGCGCFLDDQDGTSKNSPSTTSSGE